MKLSKRKTTLNIPFFQSVWKHWRGFVMQVQSLVHLDPVHTNPNPGNYNSKKIFQYFVQNTLERHESTLYMLMDMRKLSVDSKISGFGRPHESVNSVD